MNNKEKDTDDPETLFTSIQTKRFHVLYDTQEKPLEI